MKPIPKTKRKTAARVRSSEIVSLRGPQPSIDAKRKVFDIWWEYEGKEAKAILSAFEIGFQDGLTAQANSEVSGAGPLASDKTKAARRHPLH